MAQTERQIQLTGSRKWWGNQLQQVQDNIYEHLENLFLRYGTGHLIIKEPIFNADHSVATVGYILIDGSDGYKICEISGSYTGSDGSTFYITQDKVSVNQRVYPDSGTTKDISRKYVAKDEGSSAPASPYVRVTDFKFYDDSGNEIYTLVGWLEDQFYTKTEADNVFLFELFTLESLAGATVYYTAEGNDNFGYKITVYAKMDAGLSAVTTNNALPADYRPSANVRANYGNDADDTLINVDTDGTVNIRNLFYSAALAGQSIISVTYHTQL